MCLVGAGSESIQLILLIFRSQCFLRQWNCMGDWCTRRLVPLTFGVAMPSSFRSAATPSAAGSVLLLLLIIIIVVFIVGVVAAATVPVIGGATAAEAEGSLVP